MWALIKPKTRHVLALALFLPMLLLVLYSVTMKTDAYLEAARFVTEDVRVATSIGAVQKTDLKLWKGFNFTGSSATFSIEATTIKGIYIVDVHLQCIAGEWKVKTADVLNEGNSMQIIRMD